MIVALVHSRGFVLDKKFYCLELAYLDFAGRSVTFAVRSPLSFAEIKARHPRMPLSTNVATEGERVLPYRRVLEFLRERRDEFRRAFPDRTLRFGFKGKSFQPDALRLAGISNVANVEDPAVGGVPSIRLLKRMFPDERRNCLNHRDPEQDCAEWTVRLIGRFLRTRAERKPAPADSTAEVA